MSTVPVPTLGPTGYVEPAVSDILSAVLADINTAFGGGLNITLPAALNTPQGQLASALAAYISDKNDLFLNYVNQVDPLYASGAMQDALGLLYFQQRFPATSTSGPCVCTGLPGTAIPINAQAQDVDGNIYICSDGGTIPGIGSITLTFANQVTGPIPCLAGALNRIYLAVPGWSGITNAADLVLGQNVENAQNFELRRQASVSANAISVLDSIRAAVIASGSGLIPPNVPSSVYATENYTDSPVVIGGVPLKAHSIYIAVLGGDPQAIGSAILQKKSAGCDYNGNMTVTVEDDTLTPPVSYAVTYQVPTPVTIFFQVVIKNSASLPSNIATLIKNAIVDLFATPNNQYGQIGGQLLASEFYAAVTACATGVRIVEILVGTTTSPTNLAVQTLINQFPFVPVDGSSISVVLS